MPLDESIRTSAEREEIRSEQARVGILRDRAVRASAAAAVLWLVGYAAATALTTPGSSGRRFVGDIVYLVPIACAAVLSAFATRRAQGRARRFWWLLVASNGLWLGGDVIWAVYAYVLRREAPFPSVADASYLASYLLVPVALLVGFGGASGLRRLRGLIDSVVVALGIGAVGWQVLIAPQVSYGVSLATVTGIAYPLLGVVIVITLVSVGLAGHRNVPWSLWLVGAAFTVSALTDAGYTYLSSLHTYVSGDWLNLGWQAEAVVLCLAGLVAYRHREGDSQATAIGRDLAMGPVLVGVVCALVLAAVEGLHHSITWPSVTVLALTVTGLVFRFVLSVTDARRVAVRLDESLREQQRLAVTDGLTGVYNRRFFEEILRMEAERALRDGNSLTLLVADLDHFKRVNDLYGHQAGDAILVEAAARLRRAVRGSDIVARYGGEEFVAVLPGVGALPAVELAERCRTMLGDEPVRLADGTAVSITASLGVAVLPGDGRDPNTLVKNADRALYAAKDAGRDRVVTAATTRPRAVSAGPASGFEPGPLDALERLADAVDARVGVDEHSVAMARWAVVLADALGLDAHRRDLAVTGARLHDIGKFALDERILAKPGSLDDDEWHQMRTHPARGAELVLAMTGREDLARIVRAHHERVDGRGYPDGLSGADLPVEARLISVLDTWAAMRATRSYASQRSVADARMELHRVAGTQLDADIVEVFLALQERGVIEDPRPLAEDDEAAA